MNVQRKALSVTDIQNWLKNRIASALRTSVADISSTMMFQELGMDSLTIVQIASDAGKWLECSVEPDVAYEHPTIEELAAHLATLCQR